MDVKTLDLIEKISKEHSQKTFGYLEEDDLKNEIWVICLEKIKDYDPARGELENFLRVAVRNRLVNKFKDVTKNVRSPCPRCPFFRPNEVPGDCGKFFEEKHQCNKWANYSLSVQSRNSLLTVSDQKTERRAETDFVDQLAAREAKDQVYDTVSLLYKNDLDQLLSTGKISKQRMHKLRKEINKNEESVQLTVKGKKPKKRRKKKRRRKANAHTTSKNRNSREIH